MFTMTSGKEMVIVISIKVRFAVFVHEPKRWQVYDT